MRRLLGDEDELDREQAHPVDEAPIAFPPAPPWPWIASVSAGALIPRLVYLFFFADPENAGDGFTDAYHHWQIAYLTKEIGLTHGPRLWDLRGFEYVWGLMHPALMDGVFFATGSSDIVLDRLVSIAFGTATVVLLFLLSHRYWGMNVAVAAAAFASLNPAAVFNDAAGLVEPIGVSLILVGIWLSLARGFWSGVAWGLAAVARAEAWLFGAGLVVARLLGPRARRWRPVLGWGLVIGLYAKFMWDQTGNPLYPLYWNFGFVFFGAGGPNPQLTAAQQSLVVPLLVGALASLSGLAWTLYRRPPSYLLLTYGFGYSGYSFVTYLFVDAWKERRFELPMDFAAILLAVALFRIVPRHMPNLRIPAAGVAALAVALMQGWWIPIQSAYASTTATYRDHVAIGRAIGAVYNQPEYRGGVIAVPGDEPTLVYTMAHYGNVPGNRLSSEFYDPFYYLPAGYRYADHKDVAGTLLQCWLVSTQTRLLLVPPASDFNHSVPDYMAFMADHPAWFTDTGANLGDGLRLFGVQVPAISAATCRAAQSTAR